MILLMLRAAYALGWLCLAGGVLLQLTVRDSVPGLALLFYAMPKPCLAALAFTLLVWPKSGRKGRLAAGLAMLAITGWWVALSWSTGRPNLEFVKTETGKQEEFRLLYWNLCRPSGMHQDMVDLVKEFQPHVAAFVEPGSKAGQLLPKYEALLPGYQAQFMPRGILWLARVPTRYRERGKLEGIGAFARFDVDGLGPTFPVVIADVFPHVLHSRKGQLAEALEHTLGRNDALMAGDFNAPAESVFFKPYRERSFVDALEAGGSGFRETWPIGLPLLSLDHVWAGSEWQVVTARKVNRMSSDHAALLVTLRRR